MKKKTLLKRIEELERRVAELEKLKPDIIVDLPNYKWTGPGYLSTGTPLPEPPYIVTCTHNGAPID